MEIEYTLQASEDLAFWKKSNNVAVLKKIRKLVDSIPQTPYEGLGKPEPLKYGLSGCWSRYFLLYWFCMYDFSCIRV